MSGQVLNSQLPNRTDRSQTGPGLAGMHPNNFAMVMATGIIAIAAHQQHNAFVAHSLFVLNLIFFATLCLCTIVRVALHSQEMKKDLFNHNRSMSYLTAVAGMCILGSECQLQAHASVCAAALFIAAGSLWLILNYSILSALILSKAKPELAEGINGSWLVLVVSTESLAVLGARLASSFADLQTPLLWISLCLFLLGGAIYGWLLPLILYRYTFFPMRAEQINPTHWVDMGSMSIAVLAGSQLLAAIASHPEFGQMNAFIAGATCTFWAVATWWLPLSAILAIAHIVASRFRMQYEPTWWSVVFPIGMYGACTHKFAQSFKIPQLDAVSNVMLYLSLGVWLFVLYGFVAARVRASIRTGGVLAHQQNVRLLK